MPANPPTEYLDLDAAAKEFARRGIPVKRSTVRTWHLNGELRSFKRGRILLIPRTAIDEFLAENTKLQL